MSRVECPQCCYSDRGGGAVTGVSGWDVGHIHRGSGGLAPPPLLFRRHQPSELTSRRGRGLAMSRALPRGALCMRGRDPGPPSCGVRDFHAPPDLLVRTLAPRPGGPGPSHAITTAGTLRDDRHNLRGAKDGAQDDSDARRLPTVHFLQCSTTIPAIRGKTTTSARPTLMYTAPPYNYKRRGWASFCAG